MGFKQQAVLNTAVVVGTCLLTNTQQNPLANKAVVMAMSVPLTNILSLAATPWHANRRTRRRIWWRKAFPVAQAFNAVLLFTKKGPLDVLASMCLLAWAGHELQINAS